MYLHDTICKAQLKGTFLDLDVLNCETCIKIAMCRVQAYTIEHFDVNSKYPYHNA